MFIENFRIIAKGKNHSKPSNRKIRLNVQAIILYTQPICPFLITFTGDIFRVFPRLVDDNVPFFPSQPFFLW